MPKSSERKLEYMKQYHQQNKDHRNEMRNKRIECECGCVISKGHKWEHIKTKKHLDLMESKK